MNKTLPKSSRSRYPTTPPAVRRITPNEAHAAAAPANFTRGFDGRTSAELPSARRANERTYVNADGTRTTEVSAAPLNYRKADGSWAPIDTHLSPSADGWQATANATPTTVTSNANAAEAVHVDLGGGRSVGYAMSGAASVPGTADGSTVTYPAAWRDTDVKAEVRPGGELKETLVLRSADVPRSFGFPLRLHGLTARLDGQRVVLADATGTVRAVIPAGSMEDAAHVRSGAVRYAIESSAGATVLRITPDSGWLADPARKFPVEVDPTLAPAVGNQGASESMYVQGSNSVGGGSDLLVGPQNGASTASYIKFGAIGSTQLKYYTILGAQLQLVNWQAPSCAPRAVSVHPVTSAWSESGNYTFDTRPATGNALASGSFAHGYVAGGQILCPGAGELIPLGNAGRQLVQQWADGGVNNGLALLASNSDPMSAKKFVGRTSVNGPKLWVTYSEFNAKYSIPKPVPDPPVLQNKDGAVEITVTNLSASTWQPGQYYLAYRAYDAKTGKPVTQQKAAELTTAVARTGKVTLKATIKQMLEGTYFLDFTMVRKSGSVFFTDQQVPPGRIVIRIVNIPPVVQELQPLNGYQTPTLTPQLWVRAVDPDKPPKATLQYKFEICDRNADATPANCLNSAYSLNPAWPVPASKLSWAKLYLWRVTIKDGSAETQAPYQVLVADVPQPDITSRVAAAPYGSRNQEFDAQVGNYSTTMQDAPVATLGPGLSIVRTYNSLDPRRNGAFGAGWVTRYDMRIVEDLDGSGNVVVTYPDGQQVRFGKNPDGTYAAPQGRTSKLTLAGGLWTLADRARTSYVFSSNGRLLRITDASNKSTVVSYDTGGKLATASSTTSVSNPVPVRNLKFGWTGTHVTSVTTDPVDGAPLVWQYKYQGDLLSEVCAPTQPCTKYTYAKGSAYRASVLDSKPEGYLRLGETDGSFAASEVAVNLGKDAGTYVNMTPGSSAGALAGTDNKAGSFNGTSSSVTLPSGMLQKSRDAAIELWFKANATGAGGPLLGYQDKKIGETATKAVPVLYIGDDGALRGQFANGTVLPLDSRNPATTNGSYLDSRWHQVVLSATGNTQVLYVDGKKVKSVDGPNIDHNGLTFNQLGAASATSAWTGWGATAQRYFSGSLDDFAVYSHPLGEVAVADHYRYGTTEANQLSEVTMPSGKSAVQMKYDDNTGRITEYTDRNGGTWKIGLPTVYGSDTDLRRSIQVRDPGNRPYLYEYDALNGRMLRSGSPTGLEARPEDRPGDPSPAPEPPKEQCNTPDPGDPEFCTQIPGSDDGPVFEHHTLEGMAIRTFDYDDRGFQKRIVDELGDTVDMTYDDRGNVTSRKTCRTQLACYTSYSTYPPTPADPLDPRADLVTETRDERSKDNADPTYLTKYSYTPSGQLEKQVNPDGSTVRHTYTDGTNGIPSGLVQETYDARNKKQTNHYFPNGDLSGVDSPSDMGTTFTYDALGRKLTETQKSDSYPSGVATTYTYDALSRIQTVTGPVTHDAVTNAEHQLKTTNFYDDDGNVSRTETTDTKVDGQTRTVKYDYDAHNRQVRVTDAKNNETNVSYDQFGNKTSVTDARGVRTDYAYTARNAVAEVRIRNWEGAAGEPGKPDHLVVESNSYDFAGRLASKTDAMGRRVEYEYYGDDKLHTATLKNFHNSDGSTRDVVLENDAYDAAGNLAQQTTDNGKTRVNYTVNVAGQVEKTVADPDGLARTQTAEYDANGNLFRSRSSGKASNVPWWIDATAQELIQYGYDDSGNQTTETVYDGPKTQVTVRKYDQRGLMTAVITPAGNVQGANPEPYTTRFEYDELGHQTKVTGAAVQAESAGQAPKLVQPVQLTGYDAFGEQISTKDPLGSVTSVEYDELGQVVKSKGPAYVPPGGNSVITPVTETHYDAVGNVSEVIDPRLNVTKYAYDQLNRMTVKDLPSKTNDERAVWKYSYTRTGKVLSVVDPTGAQAQSTYDDLDRAVTATQVERRPVADNFTTKYTYDDAGNAIEVAAPSGDVTKNEYDTSGDLLRTISPAKVQEQFGYGITGRQVRHTDGLGRTSRNDYDLFGRMTGESDLNANGEVLRSQSYEYDAAGNVSANTNALKRTTQFEYDNASRLVKQIEPVTDGKSITTSYGYDVVGNRTRYTDGRQNATYYTYNALGLPESVIEPRTTAQPKAEDRTWTAVYTAAGQPSTFIAPGGVTRHREYDAAGRLSKETGDGAESATAERRQGYDLAGRMTSVSAPGGDNAYNYNDRGMLLTASGPSGSAEFGYDRNGAVAKRTDAAGTSEFGYDKGRLKTVTDGITKVQETLDYDGAGALKTIDYGAGRVRTFDYDDFGRNTADTLRNSGSSSVAAVTYGYDLENHLTSKTTSGTAGAASNVYGYDYAGRITSWTTGGKTTAYEWDDSGNRTKAGDKVATYDERNRLLSDGDYTYTYTARGTLATRTSSGLAEKFSFDAFDRLIKNDSQEYSYDGLDRLSTRNAAKFQYAGLSDGPVTDGSELYARDPSDELLAVSQGSTKRLAISDGHGDVVASIDPADTALTKVGDSTAYDPFGNVTATAGAKSNLGYQGDYTDPSSGQVDMGARWYNPGSGTFDSRDSVNYGTGASILANRYTYGAGAPLDYDDPDGHWPDWLDRGIRAVRNSSFGRAAVSVWNAGFEMARSAWHATSSFFSSGVNWVKNAWNNRDHYIDVAKKAVKDWGRQAAASAREKAESVKRAVQRKTEKFSEWVTKTAPVKIIAAALKPYVDVNKLIKDAVRLPARVVAWQVDVVKDGITAAEKVYQKAVDVTAGQVQIVSNGVAAVGEFVQTHKAEIAGFVAGAVVGAGCGALIGWTGVGAVACGALAGAVGSVVTDMVEGGHSGQEIFEDALINGAIGGLMGGAGSVVGKAVGSVFRGGGVRGAVSAARGELTDIAEGRITSGLLKPCNSFAPNTGVLMADGSKKPIKDIKVGDKVRATDPTTNKSSNQPVTDVIVGSGKKDLVEIVVREYGPTARDSKIVATSHHPFWVVDRKRWADADALRSGNKLRTAGGQEVTIVKSTRLRREATVYNFTVDMAHTYYVMAGTYSILVHNCAISPHSLMRTEALAGNRSTAKVAEIAASMKENGWVGEPIEVFEQGNSKYIINGHHRVAAAKQAGIDVEYRTLDFSEVEPYGYRSPDEVVHTWAETPPDRLGGGGRRGRRG